MSLSREYTPEELKDLEEKTIQFHNALFSPNISEESLETISNILNSTTNEQRQIIRSNYKKLYNNPIQIDIKSKLEDNYSLLKDLCINMFDTPYEYDAREINKVLSVGNGSEEDIIIEIFSTKPKNYLEIVDIAYKKFFDVSLKEEIQNQFQKEFAQFLLAIMDTERPLEQTITGNEAYELANDIGKDGYIAYSSNVNLFKKIFLEKSREDLIIISRVFFETEQKNLYDFFEEENIVQKSLFDEKEEEKKVRNKNIKLIKAILYGVIAPAEFFAKKIINALSGFNPDINTLYRVLINREEIDMNAIRDYYLKETNGDMIKDIENEYNCKEHPEIASILITISSQ